MNRFVVQAKRIIGRVSGDRPGRPRPGEASRARGLAKTPDVCHCDKSQSECKVNHASQGFWVCSCYLGGKSSRRRGRLEGDAKLHPFFTTGVWPCLRIPPLPQRTKRVNNASKLS